MIELLDPLRIRALPPDERQLLDAPLSLGEVREAIKDLTGGKAPGLDGLPAEFYKCYIDTLAPLLLALYNESCKAGELPPSMREAVITLILKQGKDPTECDSYRPISLLNVDAKILGSILAKRLGTVTPSLIHVDQCGFISGRRTVHNLRRLFYVLDEVEDWSGKYAVASLDASKAFDTVCWDFLFLTLRKMGFGNNLLDWVRLLYMKPLARVCTGRVISEQFTLGRGTRQGCPLSPQLFAIVVEPMAQCIRERHAAQGITIHGVQHTVSLYADDVLLYMTDPETTWPAMQGTILLMGAASGFTINLSKSVLLPLGDLQGQRREELPVLSLQWVEDSFRYLGINVGYRLNQLHDLNYVPAVAKLHNCMRFWSALPLSPIGRVALIKMVVVPRLLYLFQAIPWFLPTTFFKRLNVALVSLLWGHGRRRIALTTLQRPPEEGGVSLPVMQHYYWAAQLQFAAQWMAGSSSLEMELLLPGASASLGQALFIPVQPTDSRSILISTVCKVWGQVCRMMGTLRPYSPDAPLAIYPTFTQTDSALRLQSWVTRGCTLLRHIYTNGELSSFEALRQEFHLPAALYLQYMALRAKCRELWREGSMEPPTAELLQELMALGQGDGAVTRLVGVLRQMQPRGILTCRLGWESDLEMEFTEKDWEVVCTYAKRVSRNARFQQIQLHILHRAYLTPERLSRMFSGATPVCPRCGTLIADLLHMFWSCSGLQGFWDRVRTFVAEVTEKQWPVTPVFWLLGLYRPRRQNRDTFRFLSLAAILAKREIARNWKSARGPIYGVWHGEFMRWLPAETYALSMLPGPHRDEAGVSPMLAWNALIARLHYKDDDGTGEAELNG